MAEKKRGKFCKSCKTNRLFVKTTPNHLLHFLISVLTLGAWLIVWFFISVSNESQPWICNTCGHPLSSGFSKRICQTTFILALISFGLVFLMERTLETSSNKAPQPKVMSVKTKKKTSHLKNKKIKFSYRIKEVENMNFGNVRRVVVRAVVNSGLSKTEIKREIHGIVREIRERSGDTLNAIGIFLYRNNDNIHSFFTVAKADWAPYGDWGQSTKDVPKSKYRLSSIEFNPIYFNKLKE